MAERLHAGRFVLAGIVSLLLILGAPVVGRIPGLIRDYFPGQLVTIMTVVVVGAFALAAGTAYARIRDRHRLRYACAFAALAIGAGYAASATTGNAEVDAVERFHFVEYGIVTFLFYRAWRPIGDGSLLLLPVLAALFVATLEEGLQWFIPARVGELHDIFLNLWAILCGLLFSVSVDPPERLETSLRHESWTRIRRVAAAWLLTFAGFLHFVHLGYTISDGNGGSFRSCYTAEELDASAKDRLDRWRANPPLTLVRLSREDQYFSEGVTHVRRRNEAWDAGDIAAAWHENLILERYFAPVLDTPSFVSATGHRWSPDQRADAERRYVPGAEPYVSVADESPIYPISKVPFWIGVVTVAGALLRRG